MKFPIKKYKKVEKYFEDYFLNLNLSLKSINFQNLKKIIFLMNKSYVNGKNKIFVCGNGGSAALANHFACDHQKILFETKKFKPFIISLTANIALGTAIANDLNYASIFSEQLRQMAKPNDILVTISSSGNSKNIIKAIKWANNNKMISISLTGFNGGISKKISKYNLHVTSNNYGIVEANHQSIINILSQYLKMSVLKESQIQKINF